MSWIPGWSSIAGTAWWSGFYFWVSIGALIALGAAEIASHRYSDRKDELAAVEQEAIQRRHDEDMARVQHDTAQANERAAELTKEAARLSVEAESARLELAKIKTPRVLTAEQLSALTERAAPFAGTPFDLYIQPDQEPLNLANQIADALTAAGWNWVGVHESVGLNRPGKPTVGMTTAIGVAVQLHQSKLVEWQAAALAVGNALHFSGIQTQVNEITDNSVNDAAVHVRVGAKP